MRQTGSEQLPVTIHCKYPCGLYGDRRSGIARHQLKPRPRLPLITRGSFHQPREELLPSRSTQTALFQRWSRQAVARRALSGGGTAGRHLNRREAPLLPRGDKKPAPRRAESARSRGGRSASGSLLQSRAAPQTGADPVCRAPAAASSHRTPEQPLSPRRRWSRYRSNRPATQRRRPAIARFRNLVPAARGGGGCSRQLPAETTTPRAPREGNAAALPGSGGAVPAGTRSLPAPRRRAPWYAFRRGAGQFPVASATAGIVAVSGQLGGLPPWWARAAPTGSAAPSWGTGRTCGAWPAACSPRAVSCPSPGTELRGSGLLTGECRAAALVGRGAGAGQAPAAAPDCASAGRKGAEVRALGSRPCPVGLVPAAASPSPSLGTPGGARGGGGLERGGGSLFAGG